MADTQLISGERQGVGTQGHNRRFLHVADVIVRRIGWIVLTTALIVGVAGVYAWQRERTYVAVTQILFDAPTSRDVNSAEGSNPDLEKEGAGFLESQSRLLLSDTVLMPVIEREELVEDGEFNGNDVALIDRLRMLMASLLPASQAADTSEGHVLNALRRASRAVPSEDGLAITLEVGTRDGDKSARLANAIAESYLASEIDTRSGLATRVTKSIEDRLSVLRRDLSDAEDRTARFSADHSISDKLTATVDETDLADLERKRDLEAASAEEASAVLARINIIRSPGDVRQAMPRNMQTEITRQLLARYALARQTQAALSLQLLEKHPDMQTANSEVAAVGQAIMVEVGRIRARVQSAYDRATTRRDALAERIGNAGRDDSDLLVQLRDLQRDEDAKRAIYLTFLAQVKVPEQETAEDNVTARVLSMAIAPTTPQGPSNFLILALGLAFGVGAGGGAAFAREKYDRRVHSEPALHEASGVPVIATIPITDEVPDDTGLLPFYQLDPSAPSSLAVHGLVRSLLAGAGDLRRQTILFTAPDENHGRTTISLNVALAAAKRGERVLLVDGDLTRRTLSVARCQDPSLGLASALENTADISDGLQTDQSGLFTILPVGRPRGKAQPLTASPDAVRQTIESLLDDYTLVIIDAGVMADGDGPGAYAQFCDFAVLVVRRSEGTARSVTLATRKLVSGVGVVKGCVMISDETG